MNQQEPKSGDPVVYHLDDGDALPGVYVRPFGDKGAFIRVMFSPTMVEKYGDKDGWFSREFIRQMEYVVPEACDIGSEPGQCSFAELTKAGEADADEVAKRIAARINCNLDLERSLLAVVTKDIESVVAPILDAKDAEIARVKGIVKKLPKTADGVPIVPGTSVWMALPNGPHELTKVTGASVFEDGSVDTIFFRDGFSRFNGLLYSTLAAAESAVANWTSLENAERGVKDERDDAKADAEEHQALFDMQHKRMMEATNRWQRGTGRYGVHPDLGNLLAWLMEQNDLLRAAAKSAIELTGEARDQEELTAHLELSAIANDDNIPLPGGRWTTVKALATGGTCAAAESALANVTATGDRGGR